MGVSISEKLDDVVPIIVYCNQEKYKKTVQQDHAFYLLFKLSQENRKSLLSIVNDCITYKCFHGIIFDIDKNAFIFNRLFFLKTITLSLLDMKKKVGIWGLPYCVMQSLFGADLFSRYVPQLIANTNEYHSEYRYSKYLHSLLLLDCKVCIEAEQCMGLGLKSENHYSQQGRLSQVYQNETRDTLFTTNNIEMQKTYESFCKYIDSSSFKYTERHIYFSKNIDFGSDYSMKNRFIYHCDYLPQHELDKEIGFLSQLVENHNILSTIHLLYTENEVSRLAYSKAIDKGRRRESFYLCPTDENNSYLADFFSLDIRQKFPFKFNGVGIDIFDTLTKSYKIYYIVSSDTLEKFFSGYLLEIGINVKNLTEKEHYYTVRYDKNRNKISERIDLLYYPKDFKYFKQYIEKDQGFKQLLDHIDIMLFAFEFEDEKLVKINIYYRNLVVI